MKGLKAIAVVGLILGTTGCYTMGAAPGQPYVNPGYNQQVNGPYQLYPNYYPGYYYEQRGIYPSYYSQNQGYYQQNLSYYHRIPDYYTRQLCVPYYRATCYCQQQCYCPPPC